MRNVFIIFLLSGLWHGANYTFIVWGIYHALLSLPYIWLGIRTKRTTEALTISLREVPSMLMTFFLVNIGWVIFRAPDLQSAVGYLTRMFSFEAVFSDFSGIIAIGISIVCMMIEWYQRNHNNPLDFSHTRLSGSPWLRVVIYYTILVVLFELSKQQESFIYFQF